MDSEAPASGSAATSSDSMSSDTATSDTAMASDSGPFVTVPPSGAWRATDLDGKDVYGAEGESIGEITDVLMLGMQRVFRTNSGPNDKFRIITSIRHDSNFINMIDQLIERE